MNESHEEPLHNLSSLNQSIIVDEEYMYMFSAAEVELTVDD